MDDGNLDSSTSQHVASENSVSFEDRINQVTLNCNAQYTYNIIANVATSMAFIYTAHVMTLELGHVYIDPENIM